ncbi:unnamed protein product [Dracunculus medinensis]|uniref:SH3 domain-binding protein 5-like protein n=1 Tax=Dracunculus medinensis TaxID=318479 RepID=A0A0N4ULS3_DRAME|nr:unnamed protein product [Dracunculus medinensis]
MFLKDEHIEYAINDEIPIDAKHLNRVHEELEKLNIATDIINKLELQLDEARDTFKSTQRFWSQKLNELNKKYGSAIENGRPYYEAKLEERQLREEAQNAAVRFERATSMHTIAKQQVKLTQDSLSRQKGIRPECLEVLNHHIQRVNEAEEERSAAEYVHRSISTKMSDCAQRIASIEKTNSRAIKKSKRYFEQRIEFTRILEQQKNFITKLEAEVRQKKADYNISLRNLEQISDAIHEERSITSMRTDSSPADRFINEKTRSLENNVKMKENTDKITITQKPVVLDDIKCKLEQMTLDYDQSDLAVFDSDYNSNEESNNNEMKIAGIGSGVILLAQQLIGGNEKSRKGKKAKVLPSSVPSFFHDLRYRTTLPEGVGYNTSLSSAETSDSEGSLGSSRTDANTVNTDELSGMIRSHSQLIEEIDDCAERTKNMLHGSLNNLELECSGRKS